MTWLLSFSSGQIRFENAVGAFRLFWGDVFFSVIFLLKGRFYLEKIKNKRIIN